MKGGLRKVVKDDTAFRARESSTRGWKTPSITLKDGSHVHFNQLERLEHGTPIWLAHMPFFGNVDRLFQLSKVSILLR